MRWRLETIITNQDHQLPIAARMAKLNPRNNQNRSFYYARTQTPLTKPDPLSHTFCPTQMPNTHQV